MSERGFNPYFNVPKRCFVIIFNDTRPITNMNILRIFNEGKYGVQLSIERCRHIHCVKAVILTYTKDTRLFDTWYLPESPLYTRIWFDSILWLGFLLIAGSLCAWHLAQYHCVTGVLLIQNSTFKWFYTFYLPESPICIKILFNLIPSLRNWVFVAPIVHEIL